MLSELIEKCNHCNLLTAQELKLERTIFRSDHASNYLALKGVLNQDHASLLSQVRLFRFQGLVCRA